MYWYQNAPLVNGNDQSSQANVYIRAATAAGLQFDGKLPSDPAQQAALLQSASDAIAQRVFRDIGASGIINPANVIIPLDVSIAFQSAGITIGGWGGAFYFWNSTFTPPEGGPPQQIGAYIMSHPAEYEKFLTANAEGANASLGTGIPTGLVSDGQVNPDATRLFFNLGYGLGTLAAANVPASIKEEILGRSFSIAAGQNPTGSPDLIDGWTFTGTDANGHGIWQRLDQLNGDYGLAVTSKADVGTAAGLDARRAIRQSQQNDNSFGPPPPDQRTELDPNSDGSYEVRQVYADYTGLETVNAAGQETAVGKMNADGSSSTAIYDTAGTQPWSYYVVNSNALNQAVEQVVFFDPGQSQLLTDTTYTPGTSTQLQQIIQYSPTGGSGYSDEWWNYTPSGQALTNLERFNGTNQETMTRTDTPDGGYVQSTFAYATTTATAVQTSWVSTYNSANSLIEQQSYNPGQNVVYSEQWGPGTAVTSTGDLQGHNLVLDSYVLNSSDAITEHTNTTFNYDPSAHPWEDITTEWDGSDHPLEQNVSNFDGSSLQSTFNTNVTAANDWTEVTNWWDASQKPYETITDHADGSYEVAQHEVSGVLGVTTRYDGSNQEQWSQTVNDDDSTSTFAYSGGHLLDAFNENPEGQVTAETTYNPNGTPSTYYAYTDGVTQHNYYDQNGKELSSIADDAHGQQTDTWYDPYDQNSWQEVDLTIAPNGQDQDERILARDGTVTQAQWDVNNDQTWSEQVQVMAPNSSTLEAKSQTDDNGQRTLDTYDWNNSQGWATKTEVDAPGGQVKELDTTNDDGSKDLQQWNVGEGGTWSSVNTEENAAGADTYKETDYQNGTKVEDTWVTPTSANLGLTEVEDDFAASGAHLTEKKDFSDGNYWDISFNTLGYQYVVDKYVWDPSIKGFEYGGIDEVDSSGHIARELSLGNQQDQNDYRAIDNAIQGDLGGGEINPVGNADFGSDINPVDDAPSDGTTDLPPPDEGEDPFPSFDFTVLGEDPLVVNLQQGAVTTLSRLQSGVQFDMNDGGTAIPTGWITPGEAFLAVDRDGDGQITSRSELISNTSLPGVTTGMQALGTFDSNGDGVVDDAEANAAGLRVWEPGANGQGGSLLTLADAGIASISLQTIGDGSYDAAGNKVVSHFTFTFLNGTVGQGAEIEFGVGSAAGSSPPPISANPLAGVAAPPPAPTAASQSPTTWTPSAQVPATPSASDLASAAALAAANQARLASLTSPAPL